MFGSWPTSLWIAATAVLLLRLACWAICNGVSLNAAQQYLAYAVAQELTKRGVFNRPTSGDPAQQAMAIAFFRSMLVRPPDLTADQLRRILLGSGSRADLYAPILNFAMLTNGITSPTQRAAFLAQLGVESQNLHTTVEDLYYTTPSRIVDNYSRVRTVVDAQNYLRNPELLANQVMHGKNGNGDKESGDGWRFRGRGLIQVTGRANYRIAGYEKDPDIVAQPLHAAVASARWWHHNSLNQQSARELDYNGFYALVGRVNAGHLLVAQRWSAYRRALVAFGVRRREQ